MRIVHVSPYFNFPDEGPVGGVPLYVYELSKTQVENGHKVTVYTSKGIQRKNSIGVPQETLVKKEGIEVHKFSSFDNIRISYLSPRLENPIPFPSFLSSLSKEHDIIHIHGHEYAISFISSLVAKRMKIPTILSILNVGEALEEFSAIHILRKILDKTAFSFTVNSAKTVIAPTEQALHLLKKFKPRKVSRIPAGIDLNRFKNLKNSEEYVLFLGRLEQTKRPEDFIKAIPLVLKKIDANFVVAGSGNQFEYLKNLVSKLKIFKSVKFIGWVPYNKVPEIIAKASVLVAPGYAGYSIMEAAAAKKPIISGNIDCNIEFIGEKSALFVKPGDIEKLAEALVKVLTDHKLAENIADKARRYIEKSASWNILAQRIIDEYKEALEHHQ